MTAIELVSERINSLKSVAAVITPEIDVQLERRRIPQRGLRAIRASERRAKRRIRPLNLDGAGVVDTIEKKDL